MPLETTDPVTSSLLLDSARRDSRLLYLSSHKTKLYYCTHQPLNKLRTASVFSAQIELISKHFSQSRYYLFTGLLNFWKASVSFCQHFGLFHWWMDFQADLVVYKQLLLLFFFINFQISFNIALEMSFSGFCLSDLCESDSFFFFHRSWYFSNNIWKVGP